jgi:hypothetical protein
MDEQRAPSPHPQGRGWPAPPAAHVPSSPYAPPPAYDPYAPVVRSYGQWYYIVPALSFGHLAWVPFLHAGIRLGRRDVWGKAGAVGAATVGSWALLGVEATGPLGALALITLAVVSCLTLRPLRREVYGALPPTPLAHDPSIAHDPTIAHVLHGRALRAKARAIAAADPLMARELRIGRPDLDGRHFQDGGLVDVNCATAEMLSIGCGLTTEVAEAIVAARAHLGSFSSIDEVAAYASLTPGAADAVREYGVVIPA